MVAVGEIENKMLSQFQSRVHSHLQGYMVPPDPPIFLLNFNKKVLVERQVIDESGGKNIKNPSEDIELWNFSTIRKMWALRNGRNRLQTDSGRAFILCLVRMSIFL